MDRLLRIHVIFIIFTLISVFSNLDFEMVLLITFIYGILRWIGKIKED